MSSVRHYAAELWRAPTALYIIVLHIMLHEKWRAKTVTRKDFADKGE
jgi:hypothetical protein